MVVTLFACLLPALVLCGLLPRGNALAALLCGVGLVLDGTYLATGAMPDWIGVPIGWGERLTLDGISGFFLLSVLLAGGAACAVAGRGLRLLPPFIAAMLLTLLADDGFTMIAGFELMSVLSWLLLLHHADRPEVRAAAPLYLGMALLSAACLIPAIGLLAAHGGTAFAQIRALPPGGVRAIAVLGLVVLGAGAKAGLAPLHLWLPIAHPAAPAPVSAVMSAAMTKVALYVIIRVLFDLCGPLSPAWWGLPLVAMGAAAALLGAARANLETDLKAVLACSTIDNVGLIAIGLGIALLARGADLPVLAGLAMSGALLQILAHAVFKTLLFLAGGAVDHSAGTRRLDRLGGLIHRMPVTAFCVLIGAASLAALPPMAGFAGEWLIIQAAIAAPRIGGIALQIGLAAVVGMVGCAAALAASAAIRLVGSAFLGRPRTPRAAAAEEAGAAERRVLLGLALLTIVIGVVPGGALRLAAPAIRQVIGVIDPPRLLSLAAQRGVPGYGAASIAGLLVVMVVAVAWFIRARTAQAQRRAPSWDCGFAAPPPWLPFGDPATQYGPRSLAQPVARTIGAALLFWREEVIAALPGDAAPARYRASWRDPAVSGLAAPALRLRFAMSVLANRILYRPIHAHLAIMVASLVTLLAYIGWGARP